MSNTHSSKLKPALKTLSSSVTVDYSERVTAQSKLKLLRETRSFSHFMSYVMTLHIFQDPTVSAEGEQQKVSLFFPLLASLG